MKLKTFSMVVASLQHPLTLAIAWVNKIVLQNSKCTSENICNSEKSFAISNRTNKIFFSNSHFFPIIFPESEEKISAKNRGDFGVFVNKFTAFGKIEHETRSIDVKSKQTLFPREKCQMSNFKFKKKL